VALKDQQKEVVGRESTKGDAYSPDDDYLGSFDTYLTKKYSNIHLYQPGR
jgi:hypothetical protein